MIVKKWCLVFAYELLYCFRKHFNDHLRNVRHQERKVRFYVDFVHNKKPHPEPHEYHELRVLKRGDKDERVKVVDIELHVSDLYGKHKESFAHVKNNMYVIEQNEAYMATVPQKEGREPRAKKKKTVFIGEPEATVDEQEGQSDNE